MQVSLFACSCRIFFWSLPGLRNRTPVSWSLFEFDHFWFCERKVIAGTDLHGEMSSGCGWYNACLSRHHMVCQFDGNDLDCIQER